MELPRGLVIFLISIVWGLVAPGRQARFRLLMNGLLVGITLGLVFAPRGYRRRREAAKSIAFASTHFDARPSKLSS